MNGSGKTAVVSRDINIILNKEKHWLMVTAVK